MTSDSDQRRILIRVRNAICSLLEGETIGEEEAAFFLESVVDVLDLDSETLFKIGQMLTARAFNASNSQQQIGHAEELSNIDSDIAQEDRMSPKDDRPTHIPFSMDDDASESEAKQQFLQRVRQLIPGIEEREGVLGGYVCLADMGHHKSEQTNNWAVYNPAALGLVFTVDKSSLYELVQCGRIQLERAEGHGYNAPDSVRIHVFNPGPRVRVRIERGTVFERRSDRDIQNLLVKDEVLKWLPSGVCELKAFGLCMDRNAPPPNGESMSLTPWVLRPRMNTQEDLWTFTDRPYRHDEDDPQGGLKFELFGETCTATTQKAVFESVFAELSKRDDEFLKTMVELYEERNIPVVTRNKSVLPDWAQDAAVRIGDGYWLHTKMGWKVKLQKLREACEVADVEFGDAEGVRIEF